MLLLLVCESRQHIHDRLSHMRNKEQVFQLTVRFSVVIHQIEMVCFCLQNLRYSIRCYLRNSSYAMLCLFMWNSSRVGGGVGGGVAGVENIECGKTHRCKCVPNRVYHNEIINH